MQKGMAWSKGFLTSGLFVGVGFFISFKSLIFGKSVENFVEVHPFIRESITNGVLPNVIIPNLSYQEISSGFTCIKMNWVYSNPKGIYTIWWNNPFRYYRKDRKMYRLFESFSSVETNSLYEICTQAFYLS